MDLFTTLITRTNKGLDHTQHMQIKGLDLATSIACHPCCATACVGGGQGVATIIEREE